MTPLRRLTFDIYGRFRVHVEPEGGGWRVLKVAPDGKRALLGVELPAELAESELAGYLDDLLHEGAGPGESIRLHED